MDSCYTFVLTPVHLPLAHAQSHLLERKEFEQALHSWN